MRKAVAPFAVVAIIFVGTGFLPLVPLRKGNVVIGHFPLFSAYGGLHAGWRYILLHLSLTVVAAGACILIWKYRSSLVRFSLRTLLYAVAVLAILLTIATLLYQRYNAVPTIPLADLVASFNARYGDDPVGKYEPPITEAEIVAAINAAINLQLPSLEASTRAKAIYSKIVQTKRVPQDTSLYAMNGWELKDGTSYTVWWVNLDVRIGKNAGFGLRIRENNAPAAKPKGEPKMNLPDPIWLPKPSP